jgi:hypothetical protein
VRRALAALVLLASAEAGAQCKGVVLPCLLCPGPTPARVAVGHIARFEDLSAIVAVEDWAGADGGAGLPGELTIQAEPVDVVGRTLLVEVDAANVPLQEGRVDLEPSGVFSCSGHVFSADEAARVIASPTCPADLLALGVPPPPAPRPCHDTVGPFGCSHADGLAFAAILPLWWRRRRRGGGP